MNIFTKIGSWLEKHFPEKITTEEVNKRIDNIVEGLQYARSQIDNVLHVDKRVYDLESELIKLKEEMNTLKTNSLIRTKVTHSVPDTMTPFASRKNTPPDFQSFTGGNQSHQ